MDDGIQYLRQLVVLEVIYGELDNGEVSKDPEGILSMQAMWRKVTQNVPASCTNSLAAGYCLHTDIPTVKRASSWLQNFEEGLHPSSSLQASALAAKGDSRSQSPPARVRGKENPRHTPSGALWFFLLDEGRTGGSRMMNPL